MTVPRMIVTKLALRPGMECKIEIEYEGKCSSFVSALKANQYIVYFSIPTISRNELGADFKSVVNVKIERPVRDDTQC